MAQCGGHLHIIAVSLIVNLIKIDLNFLRRIVVVDVMFIFIHILHCRALKCAEFFLTWCQKRRLIVVNECIGCWQLVLLLLKLKLCQICL